jgi:ubiquinone biosynthesis protein UbiJ
MGRGAPGPVIGGAGAAGAYNPCMLHALASLVAPAMMERLTLVINHVLAGEAAATRRLAAHAGRRLEAELAGWPSLLPPPPRLAFRITPAGLLEWLPAAPADDEPPPDLHVRVDAANPALLAARVMVGETPSVEIQGDAALAADVHWLLDNVRWDVAADLERFFGPRIAHEIARGGSALARALRKALRTGADLATRLRPGGAGRGGP